MGIRVWIVRPVIDFQHIFCAGYEGGVGVRRNNPLLLKVRLERVFLERSSDRYDPS
jgi:hypothetical protein